MMTFPINAELALLLSALQKSNLLTNRIFAVTRVDQQTMERVMLQSNGCVFGTI